MGALTALDLSLTATGLFHGDPQDPSAPFVLGEIATSDRRSGESDVGWNARRFDYFSGQLLAHLKLHRPDLLVLEVTSHAHTTFTSRGQTRATSRGQEFRAGLGLGRALGWVDGVLVLASAYGTSPTRVAVIEANDAKLRVTGNKVASKAVSRAKLKELWGWDASLWRESQVDALQAALGWVRQDQMEARERAILATDAPQLAQKRYRRPANRPSY